MLISGVAPATHVEVVTAALRSLGVTTLRLQPSAIAVASLTRVAILTHATHVTPQERPWAAGSLPLQRAGVVPSPRWRERVAVAVHGVLGLPLQPPPAFVQLGADADASDVADAAATSGDRAGGGGAMALKEVVLGAGSDCGAGSGFAASAAALAEAGWRRLPRAPAVFVPPSPSDACGLRLLPSRYSALVLHPLALEDDDGAGPHWNAAAATRHVHSSLAAALAGFPLAAMPSIAPYGCRAGEGGVSQLRIAGGVLAGLDVRICLRRRQPPPPRQLQASALDVDPHVAAHQRRWPRSDSGSDIDQELAGWHGGVFAEAPAAVLEDVDASLNPGVTDVDAPPDPRRDTAMACPSVVGMEVRASSRRRLARAVAAWAGR